MMKLLIGVALTGLLAFGVGVAAEAGGKGAVKAGLNVADWDANLRSYVVEPPVAVGHVTLNTTAKGLMLVNVVVKDAQPNTTFEVRGLPVPVWPLLGEVTTNAKGKGTVKLKTPVPAAAVAADGTIVIAVSLRTARGALPAYRTYDTTVPVK